MAGLRRALVLALLASSSAFAACSGAPRPPASAAPARVAPAPGATAEVSSNVLFADYAGTASCEPCHAPYVESWLRSPMHNMTREAAAAEVRGPFDGTTFHFKGDTARLESAGGARFMTIESKRFGSGTYRITKVIGGHYREDYAGIAVASARADATPTSERPEEVVLPVSWIIGARTLRYKGYSVMVKERPGLRVGPVWSQTCIFCHNTPPLLSTILGALAGSAPPYQGEVVDPLLPAGRRAQWIVTDEAALGSALERELGRLGARRAKPTLIQAISATRSRFRQEHLVEIGIGCESCHLGSAEHVRSPSRLPSLEPRGAFLAVRFPKLGAAGAAGAAGAGAAGASAAAETRAARINRACARCHQVLFSGYEHTWEGGARRGSPGGSNVNSGEARDMLLGACASSMSCVDCHAPHAADGTARLRALAGAEQDALCTRCHAPLAAPDALRAHAHHDPAGEGARCLACHMPAKNLSLDGRLSRYHRVGSPNDPARVLLDRPIECALCHADKDVETLAATMETWWKRPYDRDALRRLYGALDANVINATAERGKPHEQAVAFYVLGERRARAALPVLAGQLTHPYPLVRGYAKRAMDAIAGAPIPIDIDAEDSVIELQAKAWVQAHP